MFLIKQGIKWNIWKACRGEQIEYDVLGQIFYDTYIFGKEGQRTWNLWSTHYSWTNAEELKDKFYNKKIGSTAFIATKKWKLRVKGNDFLRILKFLMILDLKSMNFQDQRDYFSSYSSLWFEIRI